VAIAGHGNNEAPEGRHRRLGPAGREHLRAAAGAGRSGGEFFSVTAPPKNSPAKLTRRPPEPIRPGGAVMSTMTLMAAQASRRRRRDRRS
jgi:hypothetical protein